MNISAAFFGVMIFTVLILVSFLGFAFLSLALVRKSKRYRALIRDLKAQNKYEEWAEQHKSLVITDRVIQYSSIIFVLALLLFLGSVKEVISVPRIVALISGV